MVKQTAIEWFIEKVTDSGHLWMTDKPSDMLELAQFIEQAKEIEKRQINNAYLKGLDDRSVDKYREYYNEIYGTTNSNK